MSEIEKVEPIDLGHWVLAPGVEFKPEALGFVYEITHIPTNRKYIGKKLMRSLKKLKPLKGKSRGRRVEKETDWREYTSSSTELNGHIEKDGHKNNFKFEILLFGNSKSRIAYEEAKLQFEKNVLFDDNYLNGIINLRISRVKD